MMIVGKSASALPIKLLYQFVLQRIVSGACQLIQKIFGAAVGFRHLISNIILY